VHVGRGLAVRAEGKPARLPERAQPVEDGVGARRAVLPVRRARRREVFPCAPVGSLHHGAALLVARPRALVESVAAKDGLDVEEPPLHRQPRACRRVARGGRRCHFATSMAASGTAPGADPGCSSTGVWMSVVKMPRGSTSTCTPASIRMRQSSCQFHITCRRPRPSFEPRFNGRAHAYMRDCKEPASSPDTGRRAPLSTGSHNQSHTPSTAHRSRLHIT
jgi:hypothetical protein